jgi:hypothetical protein
LKDITEIELKWNMTITVTRVRIGIIKHGENTIRVGTY